MKKERALAKLEEEWQALLQTWEGLPENMILQPGAVGYWSVRDVMAHIPTWEEEAMKALPLSWKASRFPATWVLMPSTPENRRAESIYHWGK
ncbi:MAG: hypothetical protein AMJ70_05055 [Dehalococcoidia bacterium SG8_51_3]|nr:MAG: hypothetical protein AMJ70_05055 [Dehalococcoidia bacterium SG8_51_3]